MRTQPPRRGFTQVEILVTIAVILTLVSLILPIIGKTREVAHGSQCKDHLHNLAIGTENYEHQYGEFPAGVRAPHRPVRSEPGGDGFSWLVRLLPYEEQKPLYDLLDWSLPIEQQPRDIYNTSISVYQCPSAKIDDDHHPGPATYAGSHHHLEAPIDSDNHGLFLLGRGLRIVDIPDGVSHTLLIGEKDVPADDRGWMSGSRATLRNAGTPFARFIAPPVQPATLHAVHDPLAVGGFASSHPHGVNVALADGSVRLLSFDTDLSLLQRLADRADGELISAAEFLPDYAYPKDIVADGRSP